jgi:hypothetical protein
MAAKDKAEPIQIFRQFAWNLAGTLTSAKARAAARRPKTGSRRG